MRAQEPAHYRIGQEALAGLDLYSIIQDDTDSSVWIATENGIFNYNGKQFTHQIPENIKNTSLFGLIKDANGTIYCYNLAGQIYKIVNKKLQLFFTIPSSLVKNKIDMLFDSNNQLIVLSANKLFKLVNDKIHFIEKQNVTHVFKHENIIFYVRGEKNGVNSMLEYRKDSPVLKSKNSYLTHKGFFVNLKEQLCFFKENTIFELENSKETVLSFSNKDYKDYRVGLKPYATKNEVWFCHPKNGVYKIENVNTNASKIPLLFKNYYISGAMTDIERNIWLLTFDKGIIFIPNTKIENLNTSVISISKFDNTIFLGNSSGTIFKLKNKKLAHYETTKNPIKKLAVFKDLIVTNLDIIRKKKKFQSTSFTRHVQSINDSVFHLSTSNGLVKYNNNTTARTSLTSRRLYCSYYDSISKKTWLASSTGLQLLVNDSIYNLDYDKERILAKTITPVKNEIWVTSNRGVLVFRNDTINSVISTKNGLLNNRVTKLIYEKPYVYIASRKGLQQYDLRTYTFNNFTQANGLNEAIKDFEVLNDTTYLVTTNGLLQFTFNNVKSIKKKYNTNIASAFVNGITPIKNNSTLKPEQNNIEFSFLTPTFTFKNDVVYQYKLNGFEKKYTQVKKNQNFIKFSNLPAGKYTFEVRSFINKKENHPAYFSFTIEPYWYKTVWFSILMIALLLLILYGIYRTRLNVIVRKKDAESMQKRLAESSLSSLKAQMNPHFMFNAINSIQSLVLSEKRTEAYRYLTQLSDLIRNNLNMSDVSFVTLKDEIELITQYLQLEKLRFKDTFEYSINNRIDDDLIKIPSMIIQPFVENAIKHGLLHKTTDRLLTITFFKKEQLIICEIVDNGIGIKASQEMSKIRNYTSFSTKAIQRRFEILRDYYLLDVGFTYQDLYKSNKPAGTKVTIKILTKDEFE